MQEVRKDLLFCYNKTFENQLIFGIKFLNSR